MKKSSLVVVLILCLIIFLPACWKGNNLLEEFTITLRVSPAEGGTVLGGGKIKKGTNTTVSALANEGYVFDNWTEDNREVSKNTNYSFRVNKDRVLVANFLAADSPDEYTITLSANPAAGGTVSGGGAFEKDMLITVTAEANEGYVFENWREGGQEVSRDAAYEFSVTKDRHLVAEFKVSDTPDRPEYNAHDFEKLRTFLEFEHEGTKNGERIATDYDPQDPTTWPALTWTEGEELRIKKIEWLSLDLYGSLDLSDCEALETLYIYNSHLTSLDVSGCSALETLYCSGNKLTLLDLSDCPALKTLGCGQNELGELDVSSCLLLEEVWCESNHLTALNLRGCGALEILSCGDNRLTVLDLSDCEDLELLTCSVNELEVLDVSGFSALVQIYCTDNKLTDLKLDGCSALQRLHCCRNLLTFSKLPMPGTITYYLYEPQDQIPLGKDGEIVVDEEIDFSAELEFDGEKTVYTWYEKDGGEVNPTIIREGVFSFGNRFLNSILYCEMTNAKFPELTLETIEVLVINPED